VVYREAEFRDTPPQRLAFFTTTIGDWIIAAVAFACLVAFTYLLPWNARVDGRCDRTSCTLGRLTIPLATIDHLEVAVDSDDESTTTRVVAVTSDGTTRDFGEPWTNMDDDEKQAFVETFARFRRGDAATWAASYNTSTEWNAGALRVGLVLVVLGWLAMRTRIVLVRYGERLVVTRRSLVRRRRAVFTQLPVELTGGALRAQNGNSFRLGDLPSRRETAIRALLDIPEPISD